MVDVVWNDTRPLGDFTYETVIVFEYTPKLFPGCWHCMALVCSCNNPIRWFHEWQYIPFPVINLVLHNTTGTLALLARIGLCKYSKRKSFGFTSFKRSFHIQKIFR
jgi:hypothetical protein